jgi:SPRY domain
VANTTWDLATVTAVTLSGGNLVATNTGTTSTSQGAHVPFADGKTTGKYYFEVKLTTFTGGAGVALGVGTASATYAGISTAATQGAMYYVVGHTGAGTIFSGAAGGNTGLVPERAGTTGDVIGVAVDMTNLRIWWRFSPAGLWNGASISSQDPTKPPGTGGGAGITSGANVPFVTFGSGLAGQAGVAGNVWTANFGDSAFVGAVPAGYTAGWPTAAPTFVDLAGNLGGISSYGKLSYGLKKYSRVAAFAPTFAADFSVSPQVVFSGDFAPAVSFGADLGVAWGVGGDLAPAISFSAGALDVIGFKDFSGDLALQIDLGSSLSVDLVLAALEGGLTLNVALGASSLVSGPLWATAEPCPPSMWTPVEPCDPVEWEKSELCNG